MKRVSEPPDDMGGLSDEQASGQQVQPVRLLREELHSEVGGSDHVLPGVLRDST